MGDITFKAAYGDHDKEVELSMPFGGGGHYHIYIDRFYYGAIIFINDKWTIALNPKADEELTTDDRMILTDRVRQL
jgi:hypothetical protein